MRIAFHAGQLLQPVPGGIGRYERALLKTLPAAGVDLVAFAAGPRPAGVPPRIPWVDLGRPTGSVRYELWHRARRPALSVEADLVHAPSFAIPPAGDRPLVVTAHDVVFLRIPSVMTRRGVYFHRRGLHLAQREAAVMIVPSHFTRAELEHEGFDSGRIAVAPFGVDPPDERSHDDIAATIASVGVTEPYVMTVGTVEPRKDVPTIVRAVEKVRVSHPELTLVVAGPRGWGDVQGIHRPFVRVLGAQQWRVVDALYRRTAACVIASRYEGFGLPAIESMARGAATITTTGSALEEVAAGAGLLFPPGDVDACADAIRQVLEDDALHTSLSERGRDRASELTWERSARAHADAYARALAHHS
jgi:glycosyltransferase involved in cell wall biosynthesis